MARQIRDEYRSLLANNIDPQQHRQQQEQAKKAEIENTFERIAWQWFAYRKTKKNFSADYQKDVSRLIEMYLLPAFGGLPMTASTSITAVGENVSELAVGDQVSVIPSFMFTEYGTYGEIVNMPKHAVVKHPENLTMEQAAASWMQFVTAYGGLIEFGKVKAGDVVVLGAATSSVGLAAIQIAKMQGATVIATTEDDVTAKLLEITNGKGVNRVFDPVGGKEAAAIINAMSQEGRYIIYGALSHDDIAVPVFPILGKHLTVRGYELFEITTVPEKLEIAKKFVFDGLASGQLRPEIDKIFAFDEMVKAHEYMASNQQTGKIIVKI